METLKKHAVCENRLVKECGGRRESGRSQTGRREQRRIREDRLQTQVISQGGQGRYEKGSFCGHPAARGEEGFLFWVGD